MLNKALEPNTMIPAHQDYTLCAFFVPARVNASALNSKTRALPFNLSWHSCLVGAGLARVWIGRVVRYIETVFFVSQA